MKSTLITLVKLFHEICVHCANYNISVVTHTVVLYEMFALLQLRCANIVMKKSMFLTI